MGVGQKDQFRQREAKKKKKGCGTVLKHGVFRKLYFVQIGLSRRLAERGGEGEGKGVGEGPCRASVLLEASEPSTDSSGQSLKGVNCRHLESVTEGGVVSGENELGARLWEMLWAP